VLGISTVCTNLTYNFHRGNESESTVKLQAFLQTKGLLMTASTGFYGDKTVAAVKAYQKSKGLPMTGMVYGMTRAAIKADTCQ
jgi:peptidoglycan hydrolase-like protein with peptidoglycan-binding domain